MGKKGGGGGGGNDATNAARVQAAADRETQRDLTYADRPNQYSPFAALEWSPEVFTDPASGEDVTRWTQNQTFTPEVQRAVDAQLGLVGDKSELAYGMMDRIRDEMGTAPDWDQFGGVAGKGWQSALAGYSPQGAGYTSQAKNYVSEGKNYVSEGKNYESIGKNYEATGKDYEGQGKDYTAAQLEYDPDALRRRVEDTLYNEATRRLDPQYAQAERALDLKLRNQGVNPGDAAYDSAMETFNLDKNDAYEQARRSATQQGMAEASQLFNQQLSEAEYANTSQMEQYDFVNRLTQDEINLLNKIQMEEMAFVDQSTMGELGFRDKSNLDELTMRDTSRLNELTTRDAGSMGEVNTRDAANLAAAQAKDQGTLAEINLANALRDKEIEEYVGQRGFSLAEQNALLEGQQLQDLLSTTG